MRNQPAPFFPSLRERRPIESLPARSQPKLAPFRGLKWPPEPLTPAPHPQGSPSARPPASLGKNFPCDGRCSIKNRSLCGWSAWNKQIRSEKPPPRRGLPPTRPHCSSATTITRPRHDPATPSHTHTRTHVSHEPQSSHARTRRRFRRLCGLAPAASSHRVHSDQQEHLHCTNRRTRTSRHRPIRRRPGRWLGALRRVWLLHIGHPRLGPRRTPLARRPSRMLREEAGILVRQQGPRCTPHWQPRGRSQHNPHLRARDASRSGRPGVRDPPRRALVRGTRPCQSACDCRTRLVPARRPLRADRLHL